MNIRPAAFGLLLVVSSASAADWLHYRGPKNDGATAERVTIPADGPKELWRVNVGTGLSSITAQGERIFTAGYVDKKETLVCLDAATGKTVWSHAWPAKIGDNLFEGGPRATPTLDDGLVYMLGADGHLACLNATTGKVVWEKDAVAEFGAKRMEWGFSGSPTIDGAHVLLDLGGKGASTAALNKKTGALVWKAGDEETGYGSVAVAEVDGRRTALVFKAEGLVGLDAAKGTPLWRFDWETAYKINAMTPMIFNGVITISSAYNHGAAGVRVKGNKPEQVWFTKTFKAQFNSPVLYGGHLYGFDGEAGKRSFLVCMDAVTGDEKWRTKSPHGSLVVAADKLVILAEDGNLITAEATPTAYRELSRKKVLNDRAWVQPTVANGRIFCRTNTGELVALSAK